VVHNGIIENFEELKARLPAKGYVFTSETDTEVIAHLHRAQAEVAGPTCFDAVRAACAELVGAYAIAVLRRRSPTASSSRATARPCCWAWAKTALRRLRHRRAAAGDAHPDLSGRRRHRRDRPRRRAHRARRRHAGRAPGARKHSLSADAVELGKYRHYMQKEIFEQPQALANTLEMIGAAHSVSPQLFGAGAAEVLARRQERAHPRLRHQLPRRPVAALLDRISSPAALHRRDRQRVPLPQLGAESEGLVVAISQSGETADTLAALKHAQALGQSRTLAICNVPESAIVRESALRS
jgi:glucosamine--fructose-6-phosphate aminotransferase (isomerizing)